MEPEITKQDIEDLDDLVNQVIEDSDWNEDGRPRWMGRMENIMKKLKQIYCNADS